ncbi:MAG: hydrogenase maturation protease [Candidatus Kariarchaeaceae archaeon]
MEDLQNLQEELSAVLYDYRNYLIICLGNELRGDDGIGIYIGDELIKKLPEISAKVILAHNTPVNFLGKIVKINPDLLIIVDAIDLQVEVGTIALLTPETIQNTQSTTTHYQELDDLLKFLEVEMGKLPLVSILGIQIDQIEFNTEINGQVKQAGDKVISIFLNILN